MNSAADDILQVTERLTPPSPFPPAARRPHGRPRFRVGVGATPAERRAPPRIRFHVSTTPVTTPRIAPVHNGADETIRENSSDDGDERPIETCRQRTLESAVETPNRVVRRRLSYNLNSGSKRRRSGEAFRVHGNAQRTQPLRARSAGGALSALLRAPGDAAGAVVASFRTLVAGGTASAAGVRGSLLLNVLSIESSGVFVCSSVYHDASSLHTLRTPQAMGQETQRVTVLAPRALLEADTVAPDTATVLFVPQPWRAVPGVQTNCVIVPARALMLDAARLPALPPSLTSNAALQRFAPQPGHTECHVVTRFSDVPVHTLTFALRVRVVSALAAAHVSLVEDVSSKLALLSGKHLPAQGCHTFESVSVRTNDVPGDVFCSLAAGDEELEPEVRERLKVATKLVLFSVSQ